MGDSQKIDAINETVEALSKQNVNEICISRCDFDLINELNVEGFCNIARSLQRSPDTKRHLCLYGVHLTVRPDIEMKPGTYTHIGTTERIGFPGYG